MDAAEKWWKVWKGDSFVYVKSNDRYTAARDGERALNLSSCVAEISELSIAEVVNLGLIDNGVIELEYDGLSEQDVIS